MTKGIKVIWRGSRNRIDEIEYFFGIDIDDLDRIPDFSSVRADWPQWEEEPSVEYNIGTRCERKSKREAHLIVDYDESRNRELAKRYEIYWGTNTIVLKEGERQGQCWWRRCGVDEAESVAWVAFDLEANQGRPSAVYRGSRREAWFRETILACDRHCCVLTGETTTEALEAAHLIPARNGENDVSFNGITLKADLHRLFDARLFTFRDNGRVTVTDPHSRLSPAYCALLRNKRLPAATLERVRQTLSLEQFRAR